jgi:hypothetical protein
MKKKILARSITIIQSRIREKSKAEGGGEI